MPHEVIREGEVFNITLETPYLEDYAVSSLVKIVRALKPFTFYAILKSYKDAKDTKERDFREFMLDYNYRKFYEWGIEHGWFEDIPNYKTITFKHADRPNEVNLDSAVTVVLNVGNSTTF